MIRTLLVDDEEPARDRLRGLLEVFDEVEVVGEARDGEDALRQVAEQQPDLVFLDIQMPGLTGMEVAASLPPPRPRIIFCTAYDEYAIEAFEHHAADYMVKPVNRKRLASAIERVSLSIGEQRRHQSEIADATRTQIRLYPQTLPAMENLDYAGVSRAARGVGGDYYDFLSCGDRKLGIAIGDVSGKGMFAGLLMASLQARIQSLAPHYGAELDRLIGELNRLMHSSTDSNRYVTFFYGLYDDAARTLHYVNAGHNPPLVILAAATDDTLRLHADGTAVGLLPDAKYPQQELQLRPGDLLLAYTDGVTEATDRGGVELSEERLLALAGQLSDQPSQDLCEAIVADVDRFSAGRPLDDDLTLVAARVR